MSEPALQSSVTDVLRRAPPACSVDSLEPTRASRELRSDVKKIMTQSPDQGDEYDGGAAERAIRDSTVKSPVREFALNLDGLSA